MFLSYVTWRTYSEITYSPWNIQSFSDTISADKRKNDLKFYRKAYKCGRSKWPVRYKSDWSRGIFGRSLSGDRPLFWALVTFQALFRIQNHPQGNMKRKFFDFLWKCIHEIFYSVTHYCHRGPKGQSFSVLFWNTFCVLRAD